MKFEEASKVDYFNDYGNRYSCNNDFPDAGYCHSAFSKKNVLNLKKKVKKMSYPIATSCSICHTYAERILRKI